MTECEPILQPATRRGQSELGSTLTIYLKGSEGVRLEHLRTAGCSERDPGFKSSQKKLGRAPAAMLRLAQQQNGGGEWMLEEEIQTLDRHTGFCQAVANISPQGRSWVLYCVINVSANGRACYIPGGSAGGVVGGSGEEKGAWPKCVGILPRMEPPWQ